jgi:hypothetical protein
MSNQSTFTILSIGAPLVEVDGDGPTTDRRGGLNVPDGVPVTVPIDLLNGRVCRWRVDAAPGVEATVAITELPSILDCLVQVRRCVPFGSPPWWHLFTVARWPSLRAVLKRRAPSLLALWYLFTDEDPVAAPSATNGARMHQPFASSSFRRFSTWRIVGDDGTGHADVHGGDLVVVTFVSS